MESYQKLKREETKLSTSLQEAVESRPLKDSTQTDAAVVKIYFQEAVMCGTPESGLRRSRVIRWQPPFKALCKKHAQIHTRRIRTSIQIQVL